MKYFTLNNIYTAIDIGTTKICVIIAEKTLNNNFNILGIGMAPSSGLSKGIITNVPKTVESIKTALNEAKIMASFEPESAYIGISGSHIKSYYSQGMAPIKHGIIKQETIDESLSAAKSISIADDQEILHVMPLSYIIDGMTNVKSPLGMHGMRLEVTSHIITANINAMSDLINCCSLAGIKTKDIILEPIASAFSILNEEEKDLGALLIDIGGGTTDVAFYKKNSLNYTEIISIAGKTFTNDLVLCLRTSHNEAEELKKNSNVFFINEFDDIISLKSIDGISNIEVSVNFVNEILRARAEELINIINSGMQADKCIYDIPSGIVLTGGGSLLNGLRDLTNIITGIPTRIGIPNINSSFKGQLEHPSFATSYGLLLYAINNNKNSNQSIKDSLFSQLFWKMRSFIDKIT